MSLMAGDSGRHPEDDLVHIAAALLDQLTVQQRLVSVWMTVGFSREEIAQHLGLTQQELTVEFGEIARVLRRRD